MNVCKCESTNSLLCLWSLCSIFCLVCQMIGEFNGNSDIHSYQYHYMLHTSQLIIDCVRCIRLSIVRREREWPYWNTHRRTHTLTHISKRTKLKPHPTWTHKEEEPHSHILSHTVWVVKRVRIGCRTTDDTWLWSGYIETEFKRLIELFSIFFSSSE